MVPREYVPPLEGWALKRSLVDRHFQMFAEALITKRLLEIVPGKVRTIQSQVQLERNPFTTVIGIVFTNGWEMTFDADDYDTPEVEAQCHLLSTMPNK